MIAITTKPTILFEGEGTIRQVVEDAVNDEVSLEYADLRGADLSSTDLRNAQLSGAILTGANLSGANLSGADLQRVNLSGADLSGANLSGADLSGAWLRGADLSHATLVEANFQNADLTGADLSGAHISQVDFQNADLTGVDLLKVAMSIGANLGGNEPTLIYGVFHVGARGYGFNSCLGIFSSIEKAQKAIDNSGAVYFEIEEIICDEVYSCGVKRR